MIKAKLKSIWRSVSSDVQLVFHYPIPHYDSAANERYWEVRRATGMGKLNEFQRERADMILAATRGTGTLLDIGSGDGAMLDYMRSKSALTIMASDISPMACQHLRQRGFPIVDVDLRSPDAIEALAEVDYISLCEVLEHLHDPESVVARLLGRARNSLVFSVPNTGYYAHRLRLLFGRFPLQWRAHPGEHLRFWTLRDMRWWLEGLGLSAVAKVRPYQRAGLLGGILPGLFARGILVEIVSSKPGDMVRQNGDS